MSIINAQKIIFVYILRMLSEQKTVSYKEILAIAFPMVVSQASEIIMQFVDRLFLSQVGILELSAALTGGISNFVFQSFFVGLVGYTNALVAQFFGAKDNKNGVVVLVQGLILSLIAYPIILSFIPLGEVFFTIVGHSKNLIELEVSYFSILMFCAIFTCSKTALAGYFVGIAKTKIVLFANVTGMLTNIPLNYVLIFGKLGFPALGIQGAAYGTIISQMIITLILFIAFLRSKYYREFKNFRVWRFEKKIFLLFLRFGIASGLNLFLNLLAFNVGLQMFFSYGIGVGTAFTITLNYDALAFIPMVGLGFATTSIVGRYMGAGNPDLAKKAGYASWRLSLVYALGIMVLFIFAAKPLVAIFASEFSENETQYILLAQTMLRLASIYTLADMTQLVFASALRGAGDTSWVMKISIILHWGYAVAIILSIRVLTLPPIISWLLFIIFIIILGITMSRRFAQGKWQNISVLGTLNTEQIGDGHSTHNNTENN